MIGAEAIGSKSSFASVVLLADTAAGAGDDGPRDVGDVLGAHQVAVGQGHPVPLDVDLAEEEGWATMPLSVRSAMREVSKRDRTAPEMPLALSAQQV
ncbi:hypothetical protein ACFXAE_14875 [Streptomyces sp. NPDC059454]|uniref:hypothetical protein n=1 Tax=Streptomyces sp. NPDC059454 TaxID=3346836 RepID=UPI003694A059